MGVRDHVPCEYFQNNGVTGILMYILKTFNLIHFQFCLLRNTDIEFIHISHSLPSKHWLSNLLPNRISCNNFQQKIASESIMKVYADSEDMFLKFKLLYVTSFSMYFCILCADFIYIQYLYSALFINYHALIRIHTIKYNI